MPKSKKKIVEELKKEVEDTVSEVIANTPQKKEKKAHYIDNERFLKELLQYFDECKTAKAQDKEEPNIPNYIGECFFKIATHLSRRPNFQNYSYVEEMRMDGVENCGSGRSLIMTIEYGPMSMKDAVGKKVTVKCADGIWRVAEVKSFGKQMLYRYGFGSFSSSPNIFVEFTKNHRWFVKSRRAHDDRKWSVHEKGLQVITDLKIGDVLQYTPDIETMDSEGIVHGIIFGDGSIAKKSHSENGSRLVKQGREYPFIRVCKQDVVKDEICRYLEDAGFVPSFPPSANGDPVYYGRKDLIGTKEIPFTRDPSYIKGFIHGWWLADGSKTPNLRRFSISTISKEAAEWLQNYAAYGGYIYIHTRITGENREGAFPNAKPLYTVTLAKSEDFEATVRSIEEIGEEEVYCVVEPVTNGFVLANGLLTGNCLLYFRNFDPNKGSNPFSYFTQIIYYAFLRRISKEQKQSYIKYKLTEKSGYDAELAYAESADDAMDDSFHRHSHEALYDNMSEYIHGFEEKVEEKRRKRKKSKDALSEEDENGLLPDREEE